MLQFTLLFRMFLGLFLTVAFFLAEAPNTGAEGNRPGRGPAEDPPAETVPVAEFPGPSSLAGPLLGAPIREWTFHKTADGAHPDGREQQVLWLMNRARANPPAEGVWLATAADPDIAGGRNYFGVNATVLQTEFNGYAVKAPAAFDARLYKAAKAHSDDLVARDAQDHTGQFTRIADAGFHYLTARGNVFAYADSSLNAHGAWNIDWGYGTADGMQTGRGHRKAIMSLDGDYTNVGVALVFEGNPGTDVGPLVATGNYCRADTAYPDHYNAFIVGTVWRDWNGNHRYDPGEGISGVTVNPSVGSYYAVTGTGGGYALPVTMAPGTYPVTFSGGVSGTGSVTIAAGSVLLDFPAPLPVYSHGVYLPFVKR
jgi:hypothetical protein